MEGFLAGGTDGCLDSKYKHDYDTFKCMSAYTNILVKMHDTPWVARVAPWRWPELGSWLLSSSSTRAELCDAQEFR
eukprot:scaffold29894_cov27-Prasinocladus_malaysianus.AAC.1